MVVTPKKIKKKITKNIKKSPGLKKKTKKPVVSKNPLTPAVEPLPELNIPKVPFFLVITLMRQIPAPGRTINIFEGGSLLAVGVTDELGIANFPDIPAPLEKELLVQVIGARGVDAEGVAAAGTAFIVLDVPQ